MTAIISGFRRGFVSDVGYLEYEVIEIGARRLSWRYVGTGHMYEWIFRVLVMRHRWWMM
jgi:hypothetical protein